MAAASSRFECLRWIFANLKLIVIWLGWVLHVLASDAGFEYVCLAGLRIVCFGSALPGLIFEGTLIDLDNTY